MNQAFKSGDVAVLLGVSQTEGDWTYRSLAEDLEVPFAKVQRALKRLVAAGLVDEHRRRAVPHATEEFLVHGLKYAFPLKAGPLGRGVPTAWGASPLKDSIDAGDEASPVWPSPRGTARGPMVEPLDSSLPSLVDSWPEVAELAALLDALRLGDARTRSLAEEHLLKRLRRRP